MRLSVLIKFRLYVFLAIICNKVYRGHLKLIVIFIQKSMLIFLSGSLGVSMYYRGSRLGAGRRHLGGGGAGNGRQHSCIDKVHARGGRRGGPGGQTRIGFRWGQAGGNPLSALRWGKRARLLLLRGLGWGLWGKCSHPGRSARGARRSCGHQREAWESQERGPGTRATGQAMRTLRSSSALSGILFFFKF